MESVAYLAYGEGRVPLELDPRVAEWHVIAPRDEPALADPRHGFVDACRNPVGCTPLRDTVNSFREICDGKWDHLPEQAFMYVGTVEQAAEQAEKMKS